MFLYLHHNRISKVSKIMNKKISDGFKDRANRCVFDARNGRNFYQTTGIHPSTLVRILEREHATDEQIKAIEDYCDQVEGKTTAEA